MIVVVDYGMGNLRSVSKALEYVGGKVKISSAANDILKADKLVLPGVGAFGDAVRELRYRQLFQPIQEYLAHQKLFLGICLGLQLLFPSSEESPEATGLSALPGWVKLLRSPGVKIPHMGWNQVSFRRSHPLLKDVPDKSYFYFVHSFYAWPEDDSCILGTTSHGDENFPAILGNDHLFAAQFHPEKSQNAGLAILKNFVEW